MCTVTYLPREDGFVLCSNRDESPSRGVPELSREVRGQQELLYPRDPLRGGTWLALSSSGRVACVLNGAFVRHRHRPPYRKSRGLVVLESFDYLRLEEFFQGYDLQGIEPFTLICVERGRLWEFRWDGRRRHLKARDAEAPAIWSSATLYPPEIQARREAWFRDWLRGRTDFSAGAVRHFHKHGGEPDPWNGFVMNRHDRVRTVSISCIEAGPKGATFHYEDLLQGQVQVLSLDFRTPVTA